MDQKNVLITFARSYLTLDLARNLAAAGHRVTVVDSIRFPVTRFSNAVEEFIQVPSPRYDSRAYCLALARIARDKRIDLLIPMHEETDIISMMTDAFPDSCRLFLSDFDTENRLHNKFEYQRELDARGIPTLKYAQVSSPEEFAALDFTSPFAFKQVYSRGSQKVLKVRPGETPQVDYEPGNPWLAQEWLTGDRYCTYSVVDRGRILAHTVYPVQYAIDGNSCLNFTPVQHPGILEWITTLLGQLEYTGQVGFDFIEDPQRGLYTIECNPRSTSGVMMFAPHHRIDRAFLGLNEELIEPDAGKKKMIGPGMLIYGWRRSARPAGTSLRQFFRDYWETDDVITSFSDTRPAMAAPLAYANILGQCRRYHVGLAEGFMHDHEWDGTPIS